MHLNLHLSPIRDFLLSAQRSCRSVARPVPHAEVAARRGLAVTRWSGWWAEAGPRQLQRLVRRRHVLRSVLVLQ